MVLSRTEERFSLSQDVFFLNTITKTLNLSLGGMQIVTKGSIPTEHLSIGLQLSDSIFIQLFGEPVWNKALSDGHYLYGVRFVDLSKEARITLEEYLLG